MGFRSSKRKSSPLPEIPHKNMQKRPWDYSGEENKERADAHYQQWLADMANKKKPKEPEFPVTPEDHAACVKMVKTLAQPPPTLTADYERSILKSAEAKEQRLKSSKSSGKSVAQLGQQKNQSCPPLQVYSDTEVCSSRAAVEQRYDDPETADIDPEFVAMYGEAAKAQGMSIAEYLNHIQDFADVAYQYRHGCDLVKHELVNELPTKMRRLHNWYMRASAEGGNWIYCAYKNEHYGHGDGVVMIEYCELFQLYQQDALDKSVISAYCL